MPPACTPEDTAASLADTGGIKFSFERLGVRVPAILVSPWVAKGTVIPGSMAAGGRVFEHASIPATITNQFIGAYDKRTAREKAADTFLDLLTDKMRPEADCPVFALGD